MKKPKRRKRKFSQKRYEELICYVINRCQPCLDLYKVQEIVRVADFQSFAMNGDSLTGETYRKGKKQIVGDHFKKTIDILFATRRLQYVKTIIATK